MSSDAFSRPSNPAPLSLSDKLWAMFLLSLPLSLIELTFNLAVS